MGKEVALLQFWDGQADVAHLGSEQPLAVAVEVGGALISSAFMARGSNGSEDLALQQILKAPVHGFQAIRAPAKD